MDQHSTEQTGIKDAVYMELPTFPTNGGRVLRMLRPDSPMWPNFPAGLGEVYFSLVEPQIVRAWKLHTRQTGLFAVPMGLVKFVLYDARAASPTLGVIASLELGLPDNFRLLRIPNGVWYGFKCLSASAALICNCADMPHDPEEAQTLPPDDIKVPFKW